MNKSSFVYNFLLAFAFPIFKFYIINILLKLNRLIIINRRFVLLFLGTEFQIKFYINSNSHQNIIALFAQISSLI